MQVPDWVLTCPGRQPQRPWRHRVLLSSCRHWRASSHSAPSPAPATQPRPPRRSCTLRGRGGAQWHVPVLSWHSLPASVASHWLWFLTRDTWRSCGHGTGDTWQRTDRSWVRGRSRGSPWCSPPTCPAARSCSRPASPVECRKLAKMSKSGNFGLKYVGTFW